MKIHEFQAKEILRQAGVAVPRGIVARTADEAAAAFRELGGKLAVVKAQIHAGGRGKGTIKDQPVAARRAAGPKRRRGAAGRAANLLGQALVTIQTGPEGQTVRQRAGRRRLRHRPRAVPGHRRRPGRGRARADGLQRRRHGHRRGRRRNARADLPRAVPSRRRPAEPTRPASWPRSWG